MGFGWDTVNSEMDMGENEKIVFLRFHVPITIIHPHPPTIFPLIRITLTGIHLSYYRSGVLLNCEL